MTTGKIIFYSPEKQEGLILTEEKTKLKFTLEAWQESETRPHEGLTVTFDTDNGIVARMQTAKADTDKPRQSDSLRDKQEKNRLPEEITLEMAPFEATELYFQELNEAMQPYIHYLSRSKSVDYLSFKRFLTTVFNNLFELDPYFMDDELSAVYDSLVNASKLYEHFKQLSTLPESAYNKVFLASQPEYTMVETIFEDSRKQTGYLQSVQGELDNRIKHYEAQIQRTASKDPALEELQSELKKAKGQLIDAIHNLAIHKQLCDAAFKLIDAFEKKNRPLFLSDFKLSAGRYEKELLKILGVLAYELDQYIWLAARKSSIIQKFFKDAHVIGDYCSKTYLRYFIDSLDQEIASKDKTEYLRLYKYLESLEQDIVMILTRKEMTPKVLPEASLIKEKATIKVFNAEEAALRWALQNRPNILIIEEHLESMHSSAFIKEFQLKVMRNPVIFLIGDTQLAKNNAFGVDTVIPKTFHPKEVARHIYRKLKHKNGDSKPEKTPNR